MKVSTFALVRREDLDGVLDGEPVETVTRFNLDELPDLHDIAFFAAWMTKREADDHPSLGTLLVIVAPDGSLRPVASTNGDGAAFGIEGLTLEPPGHYRFELRAITHIEESPRSADTGEARRARFHASQAAMVSDRRALAVVPLEVIGSVRSE